MLLLAALISWCASSDVAQADPPGAVLSRDAVLVATVPRVPGPDGRERFLVEGDTVLDRLTGWGWRRCAAGQRWDERDGCIRLATKL